MSKKLKVFKMNDYDWWADYSKEEAVKNYTSFVASQVDEDEATDEATDGAILLSSDDLSTHTYHDDDGKTGTFKDQLEKLDKPQFFASSEF